MKTGCPEIYIPSPETTSRDVRLIYARTRERLAKMLQEHEEKLSFSTDGWTSPNHRPFVAFMVHLVHKGSPLMLPLDIAELAQVSQRSSLSHRSSLTGFQSHTGIELAMAFESVLEEFKLTDKILAVTCDNVSNNNVMIRELAELVPGFEGEVGHTRCFLHVINLVAKSLIHQFDVHGGEVDVDDEQQELADEADMEDACSEAAEGDESDDEDTASDNDDGFIDEVEKMDEVEKELHEQTIRPVKVVLVKVSVLPEPRGLTSTPITFLPASEGLLQDHQLYDHPVTSMEANPEGDER